VREISDAQVQATVATLPANVHDLSLPVFVNNQLPEPQAAAPLMIQTQNEVTVKVVTVNERVVTVSDETGFRLAVAAVDEAGEPIRIAADGALTVRRDHWISVVGSGMRPNSTAVAWVFSEPRRLGSVKVAADGTFSERFEVPKDLPEGDHTTQVNGVDARGDIRSFNLAINVRDVATAVAASAGQVNATIFSDPTDAFVAAVPRTAARENPATAYALLAILLLGGALWFANGWRLKSRDVSNGIIRPPYLRETRISPTHPSLRGGVTASRRAGATMSPRPRIAQSRHRASDDAIEALRGQR